MQLGEGLPGRHAATVIHSCGDHHQVLLSLSSRAACHKLAVKRDELCRAGACHAALHAVCTAQYLLPPIYNSDHPQGLDSCAVLQLALGGLQRACTCSTSITAA